MEHGRKPSARMQRRKPNIKGSKRFSEAIQGSSPMGFLFRVNSCRSWNTTFVNFQREIPFALSLDMLLLISTPQSTKCHSTKHPNRHHLNCLSSAPPEFQLLLGPGNRPSNQRWSPFPAEMSYHQIEVMIGVALFLTMLIEYVLKFETWEKSQWHTSSCKVKTRLCSMARPHCSQWSHHEKHW